MLASRGFFIGNVVGSGSGGNGSSGELVYEKDGSAYYSPHVDAIFIDGDENVFLSQENKNALIEQRNGKIYVRLVN